MYSGCTRPLKAFPIGLTENNKIKYKITNYEKIDHIELLNGVWHLVATPDKMFGESKIVRDFVELPCGKCPSCRLRASRAWRDRCVAEALYHEKNYFITLTYNPDHVPYAPSGNMTLRKKDVQDFWKRLRKDGKEFRYFVCGEYGSKTYRPHYHAIVFGLDLPDLLLNDKGHWQSEYLDSKWFFGYTQIDPFSEKAAGYVARYTYKKAFKDLKSFYEVFGVEPEFVLMSRRPGIGSKFFEDSGLFLYDNKYFPYSTEDGGKKLYPTRYWQKCLERDYPEVYEKVKNDGLEYCLKKKDVLFNGVRPYTDILADQEEIVVRKTESLKRRELDDA